MNKHLIVIGMTLMLLVVGLCGCNEISNPLTSEEDRLVGSWREQISKGIIILFSDGTLLMSATGLSVSGEWEVKDGKFFMTMTFEETTQSSAWDYSFSDDDNTLYLTDLETDITSIYKRQ